MKKNLLITAISVLAFCACASDDIEAPITESQTEHVVPMILNVTRERFDDEPQTRGEYTDEWEDGATLYVKLQDSSGNTYVPNWSSGTATYVKAIDAWSLKYKGIVIQDNLAHCSVYYLVNSDSVIDDVVYLSPNTAVYLDSMATYRFEKGQIIINATLKPQTGRVRFKGEPGSTIIVGGLSFYYKYNHQEGKLSQTSSIFLSQATQTVLQTGYTPYIYGKPADANEKQFKVFDSPTQYYSHSFSSPVMDNGKSGYLQLPEENSHEGWTIQNQQYNDDEIRMYNAVYKMISVEGGFYQMGNPTNENHSYYDKDSYGNTYDYYDDIPSHSVYLNGFSIGEAEVTQDLWEAIMGTNPSQTKGINYPVQSVSWDDCQTFITKLNQLTGLQFRLPTEAEWEYAARGGNKSQGYEYSGSNFAEDVWWGYGSWNVYLTPVKDYSFNELGLYGMSGGVWEWCLDWYDEHYYETSPMNNPQGPSSGSNRVVRGGAYLFDYGAANACPISYRGKYSQQSKDERIGFRLAL